jgi:hypothetical protein
VAAVGECEEWAQDHSHFPRWPDARRGATLHPSLQYPRGKRGTVIAGPRQRFCVGGHAYPHPYLYPRACASPLHGVPRPNTM